MSLNKLYHTALTLVITGDSGDGKTTACNNMIDSIVDEKVNFITKSTMNTTKITTVFRFIKHNERAFYAVYANEKNKYISKKFDNIHQLCDEYNSYTEDAGLLFFDQEFEYCVVYLPTSFYNDCKNLYIIDTIGETIDNTNQYLKQLKFIDFYFPNNHKILVAKELTNRSYDFSSVIVTHADLINYEQDQTKKEKHKEHLKNNDIIFVDNKNNTEQLIIDGSKYNVYNKNNYASVIKYLYGKYYNKNKIDLYDMQNFCDIMISFRNEPKKVMLKEIYKFNNSDVYYEFKKHGYDLHDAVEIGYDFLEFIKFLKNEYKSFKKGIIRKTCKEKIEKYVFQNLGEKYIHFRFEDIYDEYMKNVYREWEYYIKKLYVKFLASEEPKLAGKRRERE
jgi:GTPase SAR1 family protein